jgi:hypothetical protein
LIGFSSMYRMTRRISSLLSRNTFQPATQDDQMPEVPGRSARCGSHTGSARSLLGFVAMFTNKQMHVVVREPPAVGREDEMVSDDHVLTRETASEDWARNVSRGGASAHSISAHACGFADAARESAATAS